MATESSAVVRFIDLAQRQHQTIEDTHYVADLTDKVGPRRRSMRVPLLVGGAIMFAAVAAFAGIYVGKQYAAGSHSAEVPRAALVAAPTAPAGSTAPGGAQPTPPVPVARSVAVPLEVLAHTGIDIRVEPAATIRVDGKTLGRAPLRIRNLTPGLHVLEIEAPAGFLSQRVDIDLAAGEAKSVSFELDAIDDDAIDDDVTALAAAGHPAAAATTDDYSDARSDSRPARVRQARRDRRRRKAALAVATDGASQADELEVVRGTLMIGSKPPCDILIDGKPTGLKTPQRAIELAAGSHRITLVNDEFGIKKKLKVEISPGETTRAIQDLTGK